MLDYFNADINIVDTYYPLNQYTQSKLVFIDSLNIYLYIVFKILNI